MYRALTKRILSTGLAVLTAMSLFPSTSFAEEYVYPEASDVILEEQGVSDAELSEEIPEFEDYEYDDEEIIIAEDEENSADSDNSDTEKQVVTVPEGDSPETVVEYYVAPGYEGTFTVEEIQEYFENEYVLPEGEDDEAEFEASAADIREVMKKRLTTYSYTDSSFNPSELIKGALADTSETDPTSGDYIKGNLIGYEASGSGWASTWNINIKFIWASYNNPATEETQVNNKVKAIKTELGLNSSALSDYEKVKLIDDYLEEHIVYTDDGTYGCHGTYAALVLGKCVCQGYATAFVRLTREAGVASKYITGMEINHAWNIVKVKEGTDPERPWYNNDTTWGRFLENDIEFLDHPRDKEYTGKKFVQKHPISLYNWGKTTAGMERENKEFIFDSVDGEPMTSMVNPEDKKPKLMVFYHYGASNKSDYPAQILKNLEAHKVLKNDKVDVYAIDVSSEKADVQAFMKKNGLGSRIRFASWNEASTEAYYYYGVSMSPFVVMVDENNVVQFANGYYGEFVTKKFGELVWSTFMYYLVEDWDHTAVIKSITLDKATMSLNSGDSDLLTVSYNPEKTCDDKTVTWSSSDESVASVTSTGLNTATVTATGSGVAIITAKCMSKTATCRVTTFTPITGVTLDSDYDSVYIGESMLISAIVAPKKSDVVGGYSWEVSDPEVASIAVSETGDSVTFTGKKSGSTDVTVTVDGKTATGTITVKAADITLDYQGAAPEDEEPVVIQRTYGTDMGALPVPVYDGHIFLGWFTGKDCTGLKISETTKVTRYNLGSEFTLYAGYKEAAEDELTILPISDQNYTGKKLKPQIMVYYNNVMLTAGKDYTVKYKNNKNAYVLSKGDAGFSENNAPKVIVTGKGNFSGKTEANFRIYPKDLADLDITVDQAGLRLTANGKVQKAAPKVKFGKTVLKADKDITFEYPDNDVGDYVKAGQNRVVIHGKTGSNYEGERYLIQTIARSDLANISKCTVTLAKSFEYSGENIVPDVIVKSGKTQLTEGRDYKLVLSNNREIGTATVIVTGIGGFTGTKKVSFKITGVSLAKAAITLATDSFTYDGEAHTPAVTVKAKKADATALKEGTDYEVSYLNNVGKGKATVQVTGIGKYTGSAKKTFSITAAGIDKAEVTFANGKSVGEEAYIKGGVTPDITVTVAGKVLSPGIDYSIKYSGNDQIWKYSGEDKKAPQAVITGKGNYSGKKTAYFSIVPTKLQDKEGDYAIADDVVYNSKPGKWQASVSIFDSNGKKLEAGKDYTKTISYCHADTKAELSANEAPAAGTELIAIVTGTGAYEGTTLELPYRVIDSDKSIAKGITFKAADKYYTGRKVILATEDITFDAKGKAGFTSDCFEIIPESYISNTAKGTAKVTLRGKGSYGGTKVINFKILAKPVQ